MTADTAKRDAMPTVEEILTLFVKKRVREAFLFPNRPDAGERPACGEENVELSIQKLVTFVRV
jgi:hypothetical protein